MPWKKFRKILGRLQHRLWKAMRVNDTKRVKNLQKLILKSRNACALVFRCSILYVSEAANNLP
ncbi:MAG: reverse transcriptase N-terminal domain-containing protein [Rhizonema sp. PD38]|nr:reverse transcriptase N-terminal domain-containing protein [Rhizonema sp. PD38]